MDCQPTSEMYSIKLIVETPEMIDYPSVKKNSMTYWWNSMTFP